MVRERDINLPIFVSPRWYLHAEAEGRGGGLLPTRKPVRLSHSRLALI